MAGSTGFTKAFSHVASGTFLSRVLGLVREQVFAHFFGATMAADAFFAAFRIPNLLRDLFAEGALSSAFVPIFKERLNKEGREAAFELAQVVFGVLTVILGIVVVGGIIISPWLVKVMTPGFGEIAGKLDLTASLTALMFPFLMLVALAALAMSIHNSFDSFAIPALAPAMFNIGVIAAAYLICPYMTQPIYGMALGVLIGGAGQLVLQLPGLWRLGLKIKFRPDFKHPGLRQIGRLITPMIGGLAAGRVNIFVNTVLASLMGAGAVAYLTYAYRLMHLPLGMIGVALGTVALPKASQQAALGDLDGVAETFHRGMQWCVFLVLPMAAFLVAAGSLIISLLFEHGQFNQIDTVNTYHALAWYSLGLIGFAGVRVSAPIYYALQDAVRPMRFSIIAVLVNLAANFALVPFLGFAGLAAATGLGGVVNFILLVFYLPRLVPGVKRSLVLWLFTKNFIAAALAGFMVFFVQDQSWIIVWGDDFWGRLVKVIIIGLIGLAGYILISFALGNIPSLKRDGSGE